MVKMPAGPVAILLDRLLDPLIALSQRAGPLDEHSAALLQKTLPVQDGPLADIYKRLSEQAWRENRHGDALRLLLAETRHAARMGDERRFHESVAFLAERHRLSGSFTAAELWNRQLLRVPLAPSTASLHATVWRELAAICEVAAEYPRGLAYCDMAIAVCRQHSREPGIAGRHVRALLQSAVLERLRGRLTAAQAAVNEAQNLAEANNVEPFTHGLVLLRVGGTELVLGRYEVAFDAYARAAAKFEGVSEHNLRLTKLRQVACLRALGRLEEALALTAELMSAFEAIDDNSYRFGQILLEHAEVQQELGDIDGVGRTLDRAKPLYEQSDRLEALRWHRHVARHIIATGGDLSVAAAHLGVVLEIASRHDRRDLTRAMLGLFDVVRIKGVPGLSESLWLATIRAALVAADLQRDSLEQPEVRWAMHAQREEIYTAAILVHTELGQTEAAAQVAETGRADVLNQLLTTNLDSWSGTLAGQRIIPPPAESISIDDVFGLAQLVSRAIRAEIAPESVPMLPLPGLLPPDTDLDAMADLVVMVSIFAGPGGWWSSTLTRERGGSWTATSRGATPNLNRLVEKLAAGAQLPQRGVTKAQWRSLGEFLLPDPSIWAGSQDSPQSIVICPDPRLWQVPHAALMRDDLHLLDVAEVILAPSLRTLQLLRQRGRPGDQPNHGRPALSLLDQNLPGYIVETTGLDSWRGGHCRISDLAAVDQLDASLLYVAGHGAVAGAESLLGPGRLTLDRLAPLRLPPLVVLNGCWSGTAESRYGQDPLSLAVGALLGGANTVIAGTGLIESVPSAHVGVQMIRLVQDGMSVAAALREAQRRIRLEHPDLGVFDWGGLCAVGTGY